MNNYQLRDEIENVLDWFDFERVCKVMEFLDWVWFDCDTPTGVPGVPELRIRARKMIYDCINNMSLIKEINRNYSICGGGFYARTSQYNEEKIYIELDFVVTSWDNYE